MDRYHKTREAILDLNAKTSALLQEAGNAIGNPSHSVEQWKLSCTNIHQNLVDHVVRAELTARLVTPVPPLRLKNPMALLPTAAEAAGKSSAIRFTRTSGEIDFGK